MNDLSLIELSNTKKNCSVVYHYVWYSVAATIMKTAWVRINEDIKYTFTNRRAKNVREYLFDNSKNKTNCIFTYLSLCIIGRMVFDD